MIRKVYVKNRYRIGNFPDCGILEWKCFLKITLLSLRLTLAKMIYRKLPAVEALPQERIF